MLQRVTGEIDEQLLPLNTVALDPSVLANVGPESDALL
jgi:hypothetical protein